MVRPLVSALGLVALAWTQQPAPQTDAAQVVADRLRSYLDSYERQIASVVAEERFVQSVVILANASPQRRRLVSDVAFLRLPGDLEWLAHRAIRSADGRPVGQGRDALLNLLRQSGVASSAIARLMVDESASYNLGRARTVNVPTLPLDLLHPATSGASRSSGAVKAAGLGTPRCDWSSGSPLLAPSSGPGTVTRAPKWTHGSAAIPAPCWKRRWTPSSRVMVST